MKIILLVLNFLIVSAVTGISQTNNVYYSRDVNLQLTGAYNSKLLIAKSNSINVVLDYETTDILIRFPLSTLQTNVDTLNKLLKRSAAEIVFEGELSLDYISTSDHPPLFFDVKGDLLINRTRTLIEGDGELHHLDDAGEVACMLGLVIHLNFEDLNIDLGLPGLENEFEAQVTQALLRRDKN